MKIIIDPGHGGHDPGARGGAFSEEDITLAVSLLVERELEAAGLWCALTRHADVFIPLRARAEKANGMGADLFVSIHVNSAENPAAHGFETFHYPGSTSGRALAASINDSIAKAYPQRWNRGVKAATFAVIRETRMPAALLEIGFISNPSERAGFDEHHEQEEIAAAIAAGIIREARDAAVKVPA